MNKLDNFANDKDQLLLEQDKYTFYVLGLILKGDCTLVLSDHKRVILCYSQSPFPVWIWTPDDALEEEKEDAYNLLKDNNFLDGNYQINLKYDLASYVIKRAKEEGKDIKIEINMFAYDCLETNAPDKTDGRLVRASNGDEEVFAKLIEKFESEVKANTSSCYLKEAKETIESKRAFFWKNDNDEIVACCKYSASGELASLGLVFTPKEHRRKHYAENLVYEVTNIARSEGFTPMLYTDADYVASNACYEKVGYVLRGKLCTIS